MKTPRVLIVDDEEKNIKLLKGTLNPENYDIFGCLSGEKALEEVSNIAPDLILLDIMMPGIDGYEVCRRLKADENAQSVPVIFVTAKGEQKDETKGLALGAVDYITKPFNPAIVKVRIRTQLELKRHRDSLESLLKERTTELEESERRFGELIENSLVGISIVRDNQILYQNPAHENLFEGFSTFIGNEHFEYIYPDDLEKVKALYEELIAGRSRVVETDFRFYPPDKRGSKPHIRWVQCRATSFTYQGEDAILLNAVDITRTKELEHQLIIKNKMLSLGRVAAGMAHEIRNPLTGINSYLFTLEDLCESEELSPEDLKTMKWIVEQIQVASNKIESVIKRVMDFSKPGAPKLVLMDINESLEAAIELSAVTMRKSGIKIEKDLAQDLPKCYADSQLIEQVILNLINNAARAIQNTQESKIIELTSHSSDNRVFVCISDSGPGVPYELREKIFDPFFTTENDGSGIGLSIAQRIIADHNGSIEVGTSKYGGAEFKIEIPIEKRMHLR